MNILYIGAFCLNSIVRKYPSYGLDIYKTSEFIIKGLRQKQGVNLDVITAPDVPSYPRLPQIWFKKEYDIQESFLSVGLINIVGVKQISIIYRLYKEACRIIKQKEGKVYVIIPYMVFHHVCVTSLLKAKFKEKVIICQTIPDIFFPPKKLSAGYWMNFYAEKLAKKSDAFIVFTKEMINYLGIPNENSMVMECIIEERSNVNEAKKDIIRPKLSVLYTGALSDKHGIKKLVEIMNMTQRDDFYLEITGIGPLSNYLAECSQKDRRIKFYGSIPKSEVFNKQNEADILINPRSDNDSPKLTKYMFPSKLVEYMLTGNPVVICKMAGIPEDYYEYVFTAKDDTTESLFEKLNEVLNMSKEDRKNKGKQARNFILENKTILVQSSRIVDFLQKF